jgi:hypothetical protein
MYESVDSIIADWAGRHTLWLQHSLSGREARFCYMSSSRGECFYISIDPGTESGFVVHASSVDTLSDVDLREEWTATSGDMDAVLEMALKTTSEWMTAR